jgi:hypothetical protein
MWLRHPGYGIYNPRLTVDGGWTRVQRQDRPDGCRSRVHREGSPIRGCARARMDHRQRRGCAGMAAKGEPSLLLVRSRRVAVPLGTASRSETKRPAATPLGIQHNSSGRSWKNLDLGEPTIAVARDRIVFNLGEPTGNIWMTEPAARARVNRRAQRLPRIRRVNRIGSTPPTPPEVATGQERHPAHGEHRPIPKPCEWPEALHPRRA